MTALLWVHGPRFPNRQLCTKIPVGRVQPVRCITNGKDSSAPGRGALIVFEGVDRSGKSTQSRLLAESLQRRGVPVKQGSSPDRTTSIGHTIDEYLKNRASVDDVAITLLFTANRFEKREEMLRLLAAGTTLVLDRYSYSGVAYASAKGLPHLTPDYCKSLEVGLPAADLVVYMAMTPEATTARGGYGQERYEKVEFQRKVLQQFEALKDQRWLTVDGRQAVEDIHSQIMAAALPLVERVGRGAPLSRLWDYQPMELPRPAAGAAADGDEQQS